MTIKCLIVDDEPLSIRVVEKFLAEIPYTKLVASCKNAFEAMDVLKKETVDLIFLDINMPKLSGISFFKTMKKPPLVIFITAYPEYAIEGFELDVLDYLLKPFSFERFLKAVNRAESQLSMGTSDLTQNYLFVKADNGLTP